MRWWEHMLIMAASLGFWVSLVTLAIAFGLSGCTYIDLERGKYLSVFQHKTLIVESEGATVRYNTQADPAVEALARMAEKP